jgi:F0F1-type ATP synthase epsilon subunit
MGAKAAGTGVSANAAIRQQDTTTEEINKQMKSALKIMHKYNNDEAGRRSAAEDLKNLFDANAKNTSTYMTEGLSDFHAAEPWSRRR